MLLTTTRAGSYPNGLSEPLDYANCSTSHVNGSSDCDLVRDLSPSPAAPRSGLEIHSPVDKAGRASTTISANYFSPLAPAQFPDHPPEQSFGFAPTPPPPPGDLAPEIIPESRSGLRPRKGGLSNLKIPMSERKEAATKILVAARRPLAVR